MSEQSAELTEVLSSQQDEKAAKIIKKYILWSMGAGVIPIPFVDMAAVTGVQLKMIKDISGVYEQEFSEVRGKSIISALLGSIIPNSLAGSFLGSTFKLVPFIGLYAGSVSMAVFSGAATYAIGKVFVRHFASGGTFLDFNTENMRQYFKEEFEKGKIKVKEMNKTK
jgi:uncharacterized protein (DUF697 family)